jgi:hypothetical protein
LQTCVKEEAQEFTPWRRSKEAFDFIGMKTGNKFNQQAIIQPLARSSVADLRNIANWSHQLHDNITSFL